MTAPPTPVKASAPVMDAVAESGIDGSVQHPVGKFIFRDGHWQQVYDANPGGQFLYSCRVVAPLSAPVGWKEAAAITLRELIEEYWELAYAEGKEGRCTDTAAGDAQRTSRHISECISALSSSLAVQPLSEEQILRIAGTDELTGDAILTFAENLLRAHGITKEPK